MKTFQTRKNGFTLVEMLVVVTLIAIVATIAISLLNGASREAAETVNTSNIRQLTNLVGSYQQLHGGLLPDRFDSLLDSTKVDAGVSYTTLTTGVYVVDNPGTVLYIGRDADRDGVIDSTSYTSKGLDPAAWQTSFRSLTVSQLTSNDVSYLASIGITSVYDTQPRSDGNLFHGADEYRTTARALVYGAPVVTVDPTTTRNGRGLYFDLGYHDITNPTNYPSGDLSSSARGAAMGAARFLVFGIGPNSTIVGDRKAGIQEPPKCSIVTAGEYKYYLLVVKVPPGSFSPNDIDVQFAGILDPMGNNSRAADSWASRTGN